LLHKYDFDIETCNYEISNIERQINKIGKLDFNHEKLEKLRGKVKMLNNEMAEINLYLSKSQNNGEYNVDKLLNKIKAISNEIEIATESLNKVKINLAVAKNKLDTIEKKKKQIDELESDMLKYKIYTEAVSKEGIPNMLLKKFIPNIQNQVNEILATLCDFIIEFDCKDKNIELHIIKNFANNCEEQKKYSVQTACGFERSIVNTAIRIVVSKLTCLSKPNVFIMDEMLSTMDDTNKNNISVVFEYLKTQFDIVVIISHVDEIKSSVDKIIQLSKHNNYSHVNNTSYNNLKNMFKLQFEQKTKIMSNKTVDV